MKMYLNVKPRTAPVAMYYLFSIRLYWLWCIKSIDNNIIILKLLGVA